MLGGADQVGGAEQVGGGAAWVGGGEQPVGGGAGDLPLPSPRPFPCTPANMGWDGAPPRNGRAQRTLSGPAAIPPGGEGPSRRSLSQPSHQSAVEPPRAKSVSQRDPRTSGKLASIDLDGTQVGCTVIPFPRQC